jgi:hypothetical protein
MDPLSMAWDALKSVGDSVFARLRGFSEQAGRQDREARAPIMAILHAWDKRLAQQENLREAMQRWQTVTVTPDDRLELVDCAQVAWQVLGGLGNPLVKRRAAAKTERDLRGLFGDRLVAHLKRRAKEPRRARSPNDMNEWMREMLTHERDRSTTGRPPTPVEEMFDFARDAERVTRVRQQVAKMIADLDRP